MRTTKTLDRDDIRRAVALLLAEEGLAPVGELSISYTPPGADRPSDPEQFSIQIDAEPKREPPDVSMK